MHDWTLLIVGEGLQQPFSPLCRRGIQDGIDILNGVGG